jgi:oligoendopeptidase F
MTDKGGKLNWDMESIFPGGSTSAEFAEFRQALSIDLDKAEKSLAALPRTLTDDTTGHWVAFLLVVQHLLQRLHHASGFVTCLTAQNVDDEPAQVIDEELESMAARWRAILTGVEEFAVAVEDAAWVKLVDHPKLAGAKFAYNEIRDHARLKMEPKLERLATELAVNGYHAWNRLYTKMAGDLRIDFVEEGKTSVLSMGQLSSKFNQPDRSLRKQAFEKMEAAWKQVDALTAIALNSQAGFRLSLYKGRRWESALFEPLLTGRLKRESVDAMWEAVARGAQRLGAYVAAKNRLLGIDQFRWYDQTAPVGKTVKKLTYDEACAFVIRHLSSFSDELGRFARMVIDKRWIEAEYRAGKAAGGFCTGISLSKESRIFLTFSGNYGEMMTLAHEIGHAYHSWVLRDYDYFARHASISLSEMASTFNELLVTDAALEITSERTEKLALLDNKLQDVLVLFCNLRARYLFDVAFYQERERGTVPRERLNELMLEAQKTAFGDLLADDGLHSLFWASKLHFYETGMPFYHFPYTFGFLFAGGVYDRAKKEGKAFAEKYRALLADTGSMTTEEVAYKHLGADLTTGTFWDDAVNRALMDIEPFVRLAQKTT